MFACVCGVLVCVRFGGAQYVSICVCLTLYVFLLFFNLLMRFTEQSMVL